MKNLARRAVVSIEEAQAAVDCLTAPDPDSSNPQFGGRRIEKTQGGYIILNSEAYRNIKDQVDQSEIDRYNSSNYRNRKRQKKLTNTDAKLTRTDDPASVSASASVSVSVSDKSITKKEKHSRARETQETVFSKSSVAEWEHFRAALPNWPEAKTKFYWDRFREDEELHPGKRKYGNWILAAHKWASRKPDEWKSEKTPEELAKEQKHRDFEGIV